MKIAFIGGRSIHRLGGIENYVYNLATKLVELGYETVVYCESESDRIESVNGIKVIHWKSRGGNLCKIILGIKSTFHAVFKEKNIEVIHYNCWPSTFISWFAMIYKKKVIYEGHSFEWRGTHFPKYIHLIMKIMAGIAILIHKNCLMVSHGLCNYYRKNYHRECGYLPSATNINEKSIKSDILQKYNLEDNGYFLYVGRLIHEKNPDYLIKAFIKSNIRSKKLVIAGANDALPSYVKYLNDLACNHTNIVFTGAVYGDDKNKLFERCFAYCIPSTTEGLPTTLIEAMSYKRICIASDIPGNREALMDSGVWCKAEDVEDLSSKLCLVEKEYMNFLWQGQYNYQRVKENFTWDIVVRKYIKYVNRITKSR